ncbi:MAG TPA: beta-ketoacyl synthase N-terminal-like domain-containing protein [Gammaproteobacteria bacterium]
MREVFIAGVAQLPVTSDADTRERGLGAAAVKAALEHAGVAASEVDALYAGNMMGGILGRQQQIGGLIADYAGLEGIEAATVEAACASGAAAARMAYLAVAGGMHELVVACGVERMTHVDRETVTRALATAADAELEGDAGESFLTLNAKLMRAYMERYGTPPERFAPFAITAHRNAVTNPNALLHKGIDLEAYLGSRTVVEPIRLFDVSPLCNGAAAVVLASRAALGSRAAAGRPLIRIAGSAAATATVALARRADPLEFRAVERSTGAALEQAGVRREDVDFFELHDAYTIISVLSLEAAGFAPPGRGTDLGADGSIGLGGRVPISTMGGLKARGHPVGATGVYQLAEAYLQLAGLAGANQVPGAEIGLVQNMGGIAATVVTHVVQRVG